MTFTRSRLALTLLVPMLVLGAALFFVFTPNSREVSIGFLRYSTKGAGEVWAVFAVTNESRFDYQFSVTTEPQVANSLWGNTPGIAPAGSVVTGEMWIAKRSTSYQLVLQAHRMPVLPSKPLGAPLLSLKSACRFAQGKTRLDLMRVAFVPDTNSAFTVRSPTIPVEDATPRPRRSR